MVKACLWWCNYWSEFKYKAYPKSVILALIFLVIIIFWGFISKWTISLYLKKLSPWIIWLNIDIKVYKDITFLLADRYLSRESSG